jgi:hypothetical protein
MIIQALLHVLAVVVICHNLLLIIGLVARPDRSQHLLSILMELGMVVLAVAAMLTGQMSIFVLAFGGYRLLAMLESSLAAIRQEKPFSPLLPVNLLMSAGAFLAYFTEMLWIFVISYLLFWVATFFIGRKLMQRKMPS